MADSDAVTRLELPKAGEWRRHRDQWVRCVSGPCVLEFKPAKRSLRIRRKGRRFDRNNPPDVD